ANASVAAAIAFVSFPAVNSVAPFAEKELADEIWKRPCASQTHLVSTQLETSHYARALTASTEVVRRPARSSTRRLPAGPDRSGLNPSIFSIAATLIPFL